MRFGKGHGTENDFVILPDPENTLDLRTSLVTRLCDRRAGLGADGVLRMVRTAELPEGRGGGPEWFMDYRNADGSIAEMCGNGVRVFARYLLDHGLASGPGFGVATRAGIKQVHVEPDGQITVDMGPVSVLGTSRAVLGGGVLGAGVLEGLRISAGNPHLAVLVDGKLDKFDLSVPPGLDPADFPDGGNVELVRVTGSSAISMRVHERGSGETRSCGTGAVAAAAAAAAVAARYPAPTGPSTGSWQITVPGSWQVTVPGGRLTVRLDAGTSWLTGPAVIVAEGELDPGWLVGSPAG